MLAACTVRRWLARNAAGVKHLDVGGAPPAAYTSLVACLPALELVEMRLDAPLTDLGCLLEALAWCPRLMSLDIVTLDTMTEDDDVLVDAPNKCFPTLACAPAFAKLRSLTKLALCFGNGGADPDTLSVLVDALAPLTGLAELHFTSKGPAVVPTSLTQLKGLRSLRFRYLHPCVFQSGCFDLPLLQSLDFRRCVIQTADILLGLSALRSLTSVAFSDSKGPPGVCSACAPAGAAACVHYGTCSTPCWCWFGAVQAASRHGLAVRDAAAHGLHHAGAHPVSASSNTAGGPQML